MPTGLDKKKELLHQALVKPRSRYKFRELRELLSCTGDELNSLLSDLREDGLKIIHSRLDHTYYLSTIPTPYSDFFDLTRLPKRGILGVISDTHLCSEAERLDGCEQAYDDFAKAGIKSVLHCGDITDGWDVYKGHIQFVKVVGGAPQAIYAKKHYPRREGMKTFYIAGNHDMRSYEKSGMDQAAMIAQPLQYMGRTYAAREDMVYLGHYSRFLLFPENVSVQMLHPRGSNPYAKSYAQQRRGRELKAETAPNLQLSGHMHTWCDIEEDFTRMIALPGVQDETEFFIRQGYPRDLGYVIMEYEIKDGGFSRLVFDKRKVK